MGLCLLSELRQMTKCLTLPLRLALIYCERGKWRHGKKNLLGKILTFPDLKYILSFLLLILMFIHSENPLSNIYMPGTYAKKYGSRNPQGVKVHGCLCV